MNLRRGLKALKPYLPNTHHQPMAVVSYRNGLPNARSWMRIRFVQLIGGRSWSLSVVKIGPITVNPDDNHCTINEEE